MGLKIIITGATGMVGEGVLQICLQHPHVEKIAVLGRKSTGIEDSKLTEFVLPELNDLSLIEDQLSGYDTCFFCLGISSVGVSAEDYYKTTYTLTMDIAKTLSRQNKDLTFCYVSGAGTDSSEKGPISWARVKGKTENDLLKLPFKKMFGMRPGFIKPTPRLKHTHSFYKYIGWLFPIGRKINPNNFCSMEELALCMISLAKNGYYKPVVNGRDIIEIAKHQSR
jgi:hypothetical protein